MHDRERRQGFRFTLKQNIFLALESGDHAVPALMENFSFGGAFLNCNQSIRREQRVGLIVGLPPEVTGGTSRRVRCLGKVLRIEEDITSRKFGIAIGFQRSQVLADT
jgi:PilZ domain-containing protein